MPATSPEDLGRLYAEAIQKGDLDAALALYEPDAVLATRKGDIRGGLDAIREEMTPFAAMKPDLKIELQKAVTIGDLALLYNTWSMTDPRQVSGRSVEVARRQPDGSWLFVIDDPYPVSD